MGTGAQARNKLPVDSALRAVLLLERDPSTTAGKFQGGVCKPLKLVEVWKMRMIKQFGCVASNATAFERLVEHLRSKPGLARVSAAIASETVLHGTGPENPGVLERHLLKREMRRCKAGGKPAPARIPSATELEASIVQDASAEKAKEEEEAREAEKRQLAAVEAERAAKRARLAEEKAAAGDADGEMLTEEADLLHLSGPTPGAGSVFAPAPPRPSNRRRALGPSSRGPLSRTGPLRQWGVCSQYAIGPAYWDSAASDHPGRFPDVVRGQSQHHP